MAALAVACALAAPEPSAAGQAAPYLSAKLPIDASIRTGTLPNGFTYFIRANGRPAKRASMRLAVQAGSIDESNTQRGYAHFLEHMGFNGGTHFKPGELVKYLESIGSSFGADLNAYTSYDETVYMLELPADSTETLTKGLTALADFAGGLTLDAKEVDRERGIVVEEWRGRLGASSRVSDQQLPVLYNRSRYAERLPIGKPDVIRNAPTERLRSFYDTWYRPERMAVVVVGDISPEEIESTIRAAFGPLKARVPAVQPPDTNLPLFRQQLVNVTSDSELTSSSIQLIRRRVAETDHLVIDYRRSLIESLFARMLNDRLDDLSRRPDARFLAAGGGGS